MSASEPVVVRVSVEPQPYDVLIGPGLVTGAGRAIRDRTSARRAAIVTDTNVAALHLPALREALAGAEFEAQQVVVPAGEGSKSWGTAGRVLEDLAAVGLDRTDVVIALGGGVIGDLAGFAAATYLRGVTFVQVPTTLLAQVDSSVGGKTGVDLAAGKNLAGAFKQPVVVLADTATLATLPGSEWQSGLAEVAKVAILDGEEPLTWLEDSAAGLGAREQGVTAEAVRRSVAFKARIVASDERESGPRESLNYGHTFGHALEKVAGYGAIPHGVAVAEGVRFASALAVDAVGSSAGLRPTSIRAAGLVGHPQDLGRFRRASAEGSDVGRQEGSGGHPQVRAIGGAGVLAGRLGRRGPAYAPPPRLCGRTSRSQTE